MRINLLGYVIILTALAACSHKEVKAPDAPANLSASVSDGQPIDKAKVGAFDSKGSDGGAIVGLFTVNFAFDNSSLDAKAKENLKKDADWIKNHRDVKVQIEGHCDQRGSVEYNFALGERRAKQVMEYLVTLGIPKDRLTSISYGKEKPISNGESEASFRENRRANFVPVN